MISREMLYAILQGLPEKYFEFLDPPWPLLARRIRLSLEKGLDPVSALRDAFRRTSTYEREKIRETLQLILPVTQIPGLSYRQREALIALRSTGPASLSKICAILAQDRRNTYRRLNVLAERGLAFKFYQPSGIHFMAISDPLNKSVKREINQFMDEMLKELSEDAQTTGPTTNSALPSTTQTTQSTQSTLSP